MPSVLHICYFEMVASNDCFKSCHLKNCWFLYIINLGYFKNKLLNTCGFQCSIETFLLCRNLMWKDYYTIILINMYRMDLKYEYYVMRSNLILLLLVLDVFFPLWSQCMMREVLRNILEVLLPQMVCPAFK